MAEVVCDDDETALGRAAAARDGRAMELWELSRLVASWEAQPDPASEAAAYSVL